MKARYSILTIALILAGCTRTEMTRPYDGSSITATIECGADATKAILIDNPGTRLDSRWQGGESIGIFGDGGANVKFSVAEADISEDGKTAGFKSASGIPGGTLTAYSPYQAEAKSSSSAITADFPAVQRHTLQDGVAQPDPQSNIMLARGTAGSGLGFRNVMAVLKIGQVFDSPTMLKSIEFRDLSGKAVSGGMSLSWSGDSPMAEITGSGEKITLDCGDGVSLDAGQLGIFFLIVPARTYEKGFELAFIADGGARTVKTVGTTQGKTLDRSVVYMIGDISPREYIDGASSQLKAESILMTSDKMDKVRITDRHMASVYDENGRYMEDCEGQRIFMPEYGMTVHKSLNPVEGGWMVFEEGSDELPGGGVYRIVSCNKVNGDYYEVVAYPEINPAAAFESVIAGEPMVDESGAIVEENGLPLDITGYIKSIVDESGNELYIHTGPSGALALSSADIQGMVDAATKASKPHSRTYKSPKLSGNLKSDNAELSVGASMTFNTRLALGVMQGSLQYAYLTVNPQITVSESLTIKSEVSLDKSFRLFTLTTHPIPVTPGVAVVVEIIFNASLGIGGDIQITASAESTTDLGTFGVSFNKGDGVVFRSKGQPEYVPGSFDMNLSGIQGSVHADVSIGAETSISVWGLCGLGVSTDYTMKCGFFTSDGHQHWRKFALQPELEFTPVLSSYFYSHKFEDLTAKVDLDPIWEKYVIPVSSSSVTPSYNLSDEYYEFPLDSQMTLRTQVPTGINGINYTIKLEGECYKDLDVVLLVYRGTGIKYTADDDEGDAELNKYRAAGIEYLYGIFKGASCSKVLTGIPEKPDQVLKVGTYIAGRDGAVFDGKATGSFQSGVAYGVVPAICIDGEYHILSTGSSAYYYNPFIYYWPVK